MGQPILVFTASWERSAPHDLARLAKLQGAELVVVVSGDEPTITLPATAHVVHDAGSGIVRFHYVRVHDWTSAGAARCLKTLAR